MAGAASRAAALAALLGGCTRGAVALTSLPKGLGLMEEEQTLALEQHQEEHSAQEQRQRSKKHHQARFRMCHWGPEQYYSSFSGRAQALWNMALEESGLDSSDVSDYGCNVPKMPWSWVQEIQAMDHAKVHNYNFQGSYMFALAHQQLGDVRVQYQARNWLIDFVKENFTENDVLKISDITDSYTPMGPYDKSVVGGFDAHHPDREDPHYYKKFDAPFFEEMASSNFTLCPGGDRPWSMRFYEAIAAGSIPVISSVYYDTGASDMWALWEIPYKYYVLEKGDVPVFRQDWVDYNMELFIKYQTFHVGDNVLSTPEDWTLKEILNPELTRAQAAA